MKKETDTPNKMKQWDYLKVIAFDVTQMDGIKVGTLIDANCIKTLEPLKVTSILDCNPYAYQTRLGWYNVSHVINMIGKKSIGCN